MDAADRRVALVWIYLGRDPSERLETVGSIDGGSMELVAVGNVEVQKAAELFTFSRPDVSLRTVDSVSMDAIWQAVPSDVGAVVFWMDDEKLVHPEFPVEMAAPIFTGNVAVEQQLHYWDGNAMAISRSAAEALSIRDLTLRGASLLTLMSDIVERGTRLQSDRMRILFSPMERFVAMANEPVGAVS